MSNCGTENEHRFSSAMHWPWLNNGVIWQCCQSLWVNLSTDDAEFCVISRVCLWFCTISRDFIGFCKIVDSGYSFGFLVLFSIVVTPCLLVLLSECKWYTHVLSQVAKRRKKWCHSAQYSARFLSETIRLFAFYFFFVRRRHIHHVETFRYTNHQKWLTEHFRMIFGPFQQFSVLFSTGHLQSNHGWHESSTHWCLSSHLKNC